MSFYRVGFIIVFPTFQPATLLHCWRVFVLLIFILYFWVKIRLLLMKKLKTCKNKGCSNKFEQFNSFTTWCSSSCGYEISKIKLKEKSRKALIKRNKLTQEQRMKLLPPSKYASKYLQPIFNEIARLIDKGLKCIARNQTGQMHGGHFHSVGSNSTIRFNLHNIHRQSSQSNKDFGGDDKMYMEGIKKEYGQEYLDFILYDICKQKKIGLSTLEMIELKPKVSAIRNKLKKLGKIYSLNERLELRSEINAKLGIYSNEYCVFIN